MLLPRLSAFLVRVHMKIWRKESPDDITAQLRRAGASRRLTAEMFMAGRVALVFMGLLAGFTLADGPRRIVLAVVFAAAAVFLPGFMLKKGATAAQSASTASCPTSSTSSRSRSKPG